MPTATLFAGNSVQIRDDLRGLSRGYFESRAYAEFAKLMSSVLELEANGKLDKARLKLSMAEILETSSFKSNPALRESLRVELVLRNASLMRLSSEDPADWQSHGPYIQESAKAYEFAKKSGDPELAFFIAVIYLLPKETVGEVASSAYTFASNSGNYVRAAFIAKHGDLGLATLRTAAELAYHKELALLRGLDPNAFEVDGQKKALILASKFDETDPTLRACAMEACRIYESKGYLDSVAAIVGAWNLLEYPPGFWDVLRERHGRENAKHTEVERNLELWKEGAERREQERRARIVDNR